MESNHTRPGQDDKQEKLTTTINNPNRRSMPLALLLLRAFAFLSRPIVTTSGRHPVLLLLLSFLSLPFSSLFEPSLFLPQLCVCQLTDSLTD